MSKINEIPKDKLVVLYCNSGKRSRSLKYMIEKLHSLNNLTHLEGGFQKWQERSRNAIIMKTFIVRLFKGVAMGTANVIPGVSGGTIALITNIYEELIDALKCFNLNALKLILKGQFNTLHSQLNLNFLIPIVLGIVLSILSLAKLFDYLLVEYPAHTWAYFFGLVLASVYYVGLKVKHWDWKIIAILIIGALVALTVSFVSPSPTENTSYFYIFICGLIGICGMILPGLSGSYILMLMGNYHLLMVKSINSISRICSCFNKW